MKLWTGDPETQAYIKWCSNVFRLDSGHVLVGNLSTKVPGAKYISNPDEVCFGWGPQHQTTDARVLVGTPSIKPQTHVFWLGPPAPNHRRTCFGWDPQHQRCRHPKAKTHLELRYCYTVFLFIMCKWLVSASALATGATPSTGPATALATRVLVRPTSLL